MNATQPDRAAFLALRAFAACIALALSTHALAQAKPAAGQYAAFAKGRIDIEGGLARLAAAREGIVAGVHTDDGADVKRGAVLAQLDDRHARLSLEAAHNDAADLDARIRPAQVRLAAAERELARVEPLVETLVVARAEVDEKRDQVSLIRAEIDALRVQAAAAQTRIKVASLEVELRALRAPSDGRVIKRFARVGDAAHASAPLFLFAPNSPRLVRADLEERFLPHVAPGMPAEIVLEADESRVLKGRVSRIGLAFGARAPSDDPADRADVRTVEMLVALDASGKAGAIATEPLLGQRVLVRIPRGARGAGR